MYHVAMQIWRDRALYDCFIGERKQQLLTGACRHIDNTKVFEKSTLTRAIAHQLQMLQRPDSLIDGIRGASVDFRGGKLRQAFDWKSVHLAIGDVVHFDQHPLLVRGRCIVSPFVARDAGVVIVVVGVVVVVVVVVGIAWDCPGSLGVAWDRLG